MARYDKYDPISGGFRAPLAEDWDGPLGTPVGVGLDAQGRVVQGAGNTGVRGVLVIDGQVSPHGVRSNIMHAGDIVDVMTGGEITDCEDLTAGTSYSAATADGVLGAAGTPIGHTVQPHRLIVRVAAQAAAGA